MIPFETWLSQIVGYCRLVADTVGLRRAWVDGNHSQSSVTDFDELYEQIFDDLDSDSFDKELKVHLAKNVAAREALSAFLEAIRNADMAREGNVKLSSPENLLRSTEWLRVVDTAERVTILLANHRIGEGDE